MLFQDTLNTIINHQAKINTAKSDIDSNNLKIQENQKSLDTMTNLCQLSITAHDYLETIIQNESTRFIRKIESLLDYGVKTIFFNMDNKQHRVLNYRL